MIEVFTANTPNGKKISIMLEEIGFDFKITKVNIEKGEQLLTLYGKEYSDCLNERNKIIKQKKNEFNQLICIK